MLWVALVLLVCLLSWSSIVSLEFIDHVLQLLECPVVDVCAVLFLGINELCEFNWVETLVRDLHGEELLLLLPLKVISDFWIKSEHDDSLLPSLYN